MGTGSENMQLSERHLQEAVGWFLRMRSSGSEEDLSDLQRWMEADRCNALAYARVSASWKSVGEHASSPEMVVGRRDALEHARRAVRGRCAFAPRWLAMAASLAAVALFTGLLLTAQGPPVYTTGRGELRTLSLDDGSVVSLDALSRIRVVYDDSVRSVVLEQGQARFDVAKDAMRPFRVRARDQTVVALGTQFNIEIVPDAVLVTLLEGRVAVARSAPSLPAQDFTFDVTAGVAPRQEIGAATIEAEIDAASSGAAVFLAPGQQLVAAAAKPTEIRSGVDVVRTMGWQQGKLFFHDEPLSSAAMSVNRYAAQQLEVDPSVADVRISGVIKAGDAGAFIEAVADYFPVRVERIGPSQIRLTARH
jgi:transmembrane sensor